MRQGLIASALNHAMHRTFGKENQPPRGERKKWDLDGDGKLNLEEANKWYRNGKGQAIEVDLDKIDLSGISVDQFDGIGSSKVFNLLFKSSSLKDGLVHGNVTFRLYPNNTVKAFYDAYDFNMHSWKNPSSWIRNVLTIVGGKIAGEGTPYQIQFKGSAVIRPVIPIQFR